VTKGRRKKGSEVEQFNFELDKTTKKDKKNVPELIKRVRRQEDEVTRQQAYRDSFEEELKKLKESNDVLSRKCKEDITKAYACATNSLYCAASLEKENQALKDQLEEITRNLVKLQGTYKELEYSYEKLVESHTLLAVANEVMVNSVKSYTPHCTTSTCTQIENNDYCANPCGPKGKPSWYDCVIAESCDDFIAQENHDLMQEVEKLKKEVAKLKGKEKVQPSQDNCEPMVKKLEKRIIITRSISQQSYKINDHNISNKKKLDPIKCYKCSHMGHYASMCSFKEEDNPNQSKRQRSIAQRRCFGCHEKGHKIEACINRAKVPSGKPGGTGFH
jgi:phage shock protein A